MSVQALSWVFDHSPTTGADRLVLMSLANHAGKDPVDGAWESWPGIETIAREAGIAERSVTVVLGRLALAGAVERIINGAPDSRMRGDRKPNLYRVLLDYGVPRDGTPLAGPDSGPPTDADGTPAPATGYRPVAPRGTSSQQHGVPPHAQKTASIRKEPSIEPSVEPTDPTLAPNGAAAGGELVLLSDERKPVQPRPEHKTAARELVRAWWDDQDPSPTCKFIGVVDIVAKFLAAGWAVDRVAYALYDARVPTRDSMLLELRHDHRPKGRTPMSPGLSAQWRRFAAENLGPFGAATGG